MMRLRSVCVLIFILPLLAAAIAPPALGAPGAASGADPPTYLVFGPRERLATLPAGVEWIGPAGGGHLVRGPATAVEALAARGLSLVLLPANGSLPRPAPRFVPPPPPRTEVFNPDIANLIMRMSTAEMQATIQRLQDFRTRYSTTDSCRAAAMYLRDRFRALGLPAVLDLFTFNGQAVYNVVATKVGFARPDEIYIICGHYDSISNQAPTNAPGADDNASGTAAVVEAARVLMDGEFEATIRFIAFGGEEQGLVGSQHYVTNTVIARNEDVRGVLNLDMVGYVHPQYPEWDANWYADDSVSLALGQRVAECVAAYTTCTLHFIVTAGPMWGSDHFWFAMNGYPAVFNIDAQLWGAPDWNPHYHTIEDRIETLTIPYATEMARGAVAAVAELAVLESGTAVADPGAVAVLAAAVGPNPFRSAVAFDAGWGPIRITVVDVRGRLVTTLAGSGPLVWQGQDRRGQQVPAGIYFYRLEGGGGGSAGRLVRVP